MKKLPRAFYTRDVLTTARDLLGKIFTLNRGDVQLAGRIVEVEAYHEKGDRSAHTYNGPTPRNQVMFEQGGKLYVYFTYGVHYCANVVAGKKDEGCGVLLRAVEPVKGIEFMKKNRFGEDAEGKKEYDISNGPAKLCKAFSIDRNDNGADLTGSTFCLHDAPPVEEKDVVITTRIGINKSKELPWRFYIRNNPFVSKL